MPPSMCVCVWSIALLDLYWLQEISVVHVNTHSEKVQCVCNPPLMVVCVQMLCLFRKSRSQVQGRCEPSFFNKKREEFVTLGVGLLTVTKKGESAWLLMRSDTVTKKTLSSVLVSSKTPLQIALSLSPLPTPLWILARRIQTALFLTC